MTNNEQYTQLGNISNYSGDYIKQLPVDQTPPNSSEIQIIDTLFRKNPGKLQIFFNEAKDSFLVTILVIFFCLSQINEIIKKILPITINSPYIFALVKGLIAGILFWFVKHFYLSRKL